MLLHGSYLGEHKPSYISMYTNATSRAKSQDTTSAVPNAMSISNAPRALPQLPRKQLLISRHNVPRPYKCTICLRSFARREHQTRHIRTHTGEKPHICRVLGCTKRFNRLDELSRHSRIHTRRSLKKRQLAFQPHITVFHAVDDVVENGAFDSIPLCPEALSTATMELSSSSPDMSPSYACVLPVSSSTGRLSPQKRGRSNSAEDNTKHNLISSNPLHTSEKLETSSATVAQHRPGDSYHRYHLHSKDIRFRLPVFKQHSILSPSSQAISSLYALSKLNLYSQCMTSKSGLTPLSFATFRSAPCSHDYTLPSPDIAPRTTPAQSPRLRSHQWDDIHLPQLRNLGIYPRPALAPLEPRRIYHQFNTSFVPRSMDFASISQGSECYQIGF